MSHVSDTHIPTVPAARGLLRILPTSQNTVVTVFPNMFSVESCCARVAYSIVFPSLRFGRIPDVVSSPAGLLCVTDAADMPGTLVLTVAFATLAARRAASFFDVVDASLCASSACPVLATSGAASCCRCCVSWSSRLASLAFPKAISLD